MTHSPVGLETGACYSCDRTSMLDTLPPRELIGLDEHWRVAHAINSALPGWLVLLPRRHVTAIAELTDAEAAGLGGWQVRLSRALRAVTGCTKTYVVQFAEQAGFNHVHFHVVPRAGDVPADRLGPRVFGYLHAGPGQAVSEAGMDRLAEDLRAHL